MDGTDAAGVTAYGTLVLTLAAAGILPVPDEVFGRGKQLRLSRKQCARGAGHPRELTT
jgi:hypothetical protein